MSFENNIYVLPDCALRGHSVSRLGLWWQVSFFFFFFFFLFIIFSILCLFFELKAYHFYIEFFFFFIFYFYYFCQFWYFIIHSCIPYSELLLLHTACIAWMHCLLACIACLLALLAIVSLLINMFSNDAFCTITLGDQRLRRARPFFNLKFYHFYPFLLKSI